MTIIALVISAFGVALTIIGTAVKLTWWLGDRFDKITTETAEAHTEIKERLIAVEIAVGIVPARRAKI